jgi:hypothetical protein
VDQATTRTPWHLWAVGIVTLLWNGFGGYDYTMSQLRDREYLGQMMEPMGVSVDEAIALLDSFPVWAEVFWALGVWGSIAGSLLLLLRSRHAVTAFAISIVGALVSFAYQFTIDLPPAMANSAMSRIMPVVIIGAVVLQLWYARRQVAAGVLR